MTREEMKQALRCCIVKNPDDRRRCPECPLRDPTTYCVNRLHAEILAMMDAEEPRLLTEADFQTDKADAGRAIPCWKESKKPTRRSGWAVIVYGKWLADKATARYWTGKPTETQMEETPWT